MKKLSTLSFFVLVVPGLLLSQTEIVLTQSDLLGMIGSTQTVTEEMRDNITLSVGNSGSSQVWDFRNTTIVDTLFAVFEFISPSQTVSANAFAGANLVQKISDPDLPGTSIFNFYRVTSDFWIDLGDSSRITMPFDTSFVTFNNDTIAPLPVAFNNSWVNTESDTGFGCPTFCTVTFDTTVNTVDGWGTVQLPLGDFDCLRVRQDTEVTTQSIVNGVVVSTTVDSYIQYNWVGKDIFQLARVQSQFGNTNPNFTNAHGFGRLHETSQTTHVSDRNETPDHFALLQNYPNPFNPSTNIVFDVETASDIVLEIYNIRGQRVRALFQGKLDAGRHTMVWNGRDDFARPVPSGVYVSQMHVAGQIFRNKMLLIK